MFAVEQGASCQTEQTWLGRRECWILLFFLEWRRITETEQETKHRAWGEQDLRVEPYSAMPAVVLLRWTVVRDCICQSRAGPAGPRRLLSAGGLTAAPRQLSTLLVRGHKSRRARVLLTQD